MKKLIDKFKQSELLKSIILYTIIFILGMSLIVGMYYFKNKSFIWREDGVAQHIVNLKKFRELLINFFKTGNIKSFYWNIGNGMDLYSNYAYYVIGDLFAYLSVLVPSSKVFLFYSVLQVIRLYFIGITFIIFARYKKMNTFSTVIGALMYTFCVYSLQGTFRHPYFCNPLIICPLIILAIERLVLDDKPIFYSIIIASMFIMSFYFAYMLAIIIAIYASILIIYTYKKDGIKKILKKIIQILLYSIIGVAISSVVLIPTIISFMGTERVSEFIVYPYNIFYYRNLLSSLIYVEGNGYWLCWGGQAIILLAFPKFISRKNKETPLKLLFLILLIPILFSKIGSIFCGLNFPNNRWSFVFNFIFAFMTTSILEDDKFEKKDYIFASLFLIIIMCSMVLFEVEFNNIFLMQIILLIIEIIIIAYKNELMKKFKKINLYKVLFTSAFSLSTLVFIFYSFSSRGANKVTEFYGVNEVNDIVNSSFHTIPEFNKSVKYITDKDKSFYKIAKYKFSYSNLSMLLDYNSTGAYYSLTPNVYNEIANDLLNIDHRISLGNNDYNYRTRIDSLLGIKYLVTSNDKFLPYGYKLEKTINDKNKIYINEYPILFAHLYTDYISEEDYNKLNLMEKEISLLKTTSLENNTIKNVNIKENKGIDYSKYIKKVDYKIIDKNNILNDRNIKIVDKEKNYIKLKINKIKDSEIYVYFKNISHDGFNKNEMIELEYNKNKKISKNKIKDNYRWFQQNNKYFLSVKYNKISQSRVIEDNYTSPYYIDLKYLAFNLGYLKESEQYINVSFSALGHYKFDDIEVYAVNMKDYKDDVKKLNRSNFEIKKIENNLLEGTINSESDGVLQFQTYYNDGFKVFVDGKEVDSFKSNKYFLGINITEGKHEIKITYNTPYIKEGFIITILGTITLLSILLFKKPKEGKSLFMRFWNWGWGIYHKNEEIWNYLIVGGLTTVVSLVTYYLCVLTFLNPDKPIELQIANVISWIVAVGFAYVTNRKFVFKSKEKNIKKEAISFVGARIVTLLLDMLTMFIMVSILHINDKISKLVSQVLITIGNYILSKLLVFKNKK